MLTRTYQLGIQTALNADRVCWWIKSNSNFQVSRWPNFILDL